MSNKNYTEWYLMKLIRHESTTHSGTEFKQFNKGTKYGKKWENVAGCPNFGEPKGFGLMQLDHFDKKGDVVPTSNEIWNWKANIDRGVLFIRNEKVKVAKQKMAKMNEKVQDWNSAHPDDQVSDSLYIASGTGQDTKVISITEGDDKNNESFSITAVDNQRDILDANIIKFYNGGWYLDLMAIPVNNSLTGEIHNKLQWSIHRINNLQFNYVERICKEKN